MAVYAPFSFLFFFFFFHHVLNISLVHATNGGFSVDLIHRDSPHSPLHDPSQTPHERIRNAARRSTSRVQRFRPSDQTWVAPNTMISKVVPDGGEYLMKFSLGTPPIEILAIADTGSDLTWTQCKPCTNCYNQTAPLFDPNNSSTYRNLSCNSQSCDALSQFTCGESSECEYYYSYGDRSFTNGVLGADTLTFDSTSHRSVKVPKVVIGCGHQNDGTFSTRGSGLVGLGGGPLSLISQLGDSIGGKFSYCLVPLQENTSSSILNFGSNAIVSGEGAISTPLISATPQTFYFLSLESISVGNSTEKIPYRTPGPIENQATILIDSGTTLTLLPPYVNQQLTSKVKEAVEAPPSVDPEFETCFSAGSDSVFPDITFHFSGAEVKVPSGNMFIEVADGVVCLATASNDQFSIFGNLAQMDFLIGYDLEEKTVSFLPTQCAKA